VRLLDVNGDQLPDITTGFEQGSAVRAFLHPGYDSVTNLWPAVTVGAVSDAEDAVFADLDDDGAVDVISSAEGGTQGVFVHWAPSSPAEYLNEAAWQTVKIPASAGRRWMFALPLQVDGQNGIDLVVGGKDADAKVAWFRSPAGNRRDMAAWTMHAMSDVSWTMSLIDYDVDNDGDPDVVVTDRYNNVGLEGARWLENPGTGSPAQFNPWPNHFIGARGDEPMLSAMADLDRDGLDDLLVPVFSSGLSFFRRLDRASNSWQEYPISKPAGTGTAKGCNIGDIDLDGDPDIVISFAHADGDLSGVVWLSYVTVPTETTWVDHEISGPLGIKFDIVALADLDGDGDPDVITTEEAEGGSGLGTIWYENPADPVDSDSDGVYDFLDNCPSVPNPQQEDADSDGSGDVCDNCPGVHNLGQDDLDQDGVGDVCDDDMDGDGILNVADNCPSDANPQQEDGDGDLVGDPCDACPDTLDGAIVDAQGCPQPVPGDFDRDGDVDIADFGHLQVCLGGPGVAPQPECQDARLDADSDVDDNDVTVFHWCLSGPSVLGDPECGGS